jgi:hypothetical protein
MVLLWWNLPPREAWCPSWRRESRNATRDHRAAPSGCTLARTVHMWQKLQSVVNSVIWSVVFKKFHFENSECAPVWYKPDQSWPCGGLQNLSDCTIRSTWIADDVRRLEPWHRTEVLSAETLKIVKLWTKDWPAGYWLNHDNMSINGFNCTFARLAAEFWSELTKSSLSLSSLVIKLEEDKIIKKDNPFF